MGPTSRHSKPDSKGEDSPGAGGESCAKSLGENDERKKNTEERRTPHVLLVMMIANVQPSQWLNGSINCTDQTYTADSR